MTDPKELRTRIRQVVKRNWGSSPIFWPSPQFPAAGRDPIEGGAAPQPRAGQRCATCARYAPAEDVLVPGWCPYCGTCSNPHPQRSQSGVERTRPRTREETAALIAQYLDKCDWIPRHVAEAVRDRLARPVDRRLTALAPAWDDFLDAVADECVLACITEWRMVLLNLRSRGERPLFTSEDTLDDLLRRWRQTRTFEERQAILYQVLVADAEWRKHRRHHDEQSQRRFDQSEKVDYEELKREVQQQDARLKREVDARAILEEHLHSTTIEAERERYKTTPECDEAVRRAVELGAKKKDLAEILNKKRPTIDAMIRRAESLNG